MKIYQRMASLIAAIRNCEKGKNQIWLDKHTETLEKLVETYMPHGSGFNSGTKLLIDMCGEDKLVFHGVYYPMNEDGYYEDSFDVTTTITPSLAFGYHINFKYSPKRKKYVDLYEEYFAQLFDSCLDDVEVEYSVVKNNEKEV